jgi:hypothetical protein
MGLSIIDNIDHGAEYQFMCTDGTYIFIACTGQGLRSYSIDANGEFTLGDVDDHGGNYYDVCRDSAGYLFVAAGTSGVHSYSVDGNGDLTYIDTDVQASMDARGIEAVGDFILVAGNNALYVYEHTAGTLSLVGSDYVSGSYVQLCTHEDYVIVAAGASGMHCYSIDGAGALTHNDNEATDGSCVNVNSISGFVVASIVTRVLRTYTINESDDFDTYIDQDTNLGTTPKGVVENTFGIFVLGNTAGIGEILIDESGNITYSSTTDTDGGAVDMIQMGKYLILADYSNGASSYRYGQSVTADDMAAPFPTVSGGASIDSADTTETVYVEPIFTDKSFRIHDTEVADNILNVTFSSETKRQELYKSWLGHYFLRTSQELVGSSYVNFTIKPLTKEEARQWFFEVLDPYDVAKYLKSDDIWDWGFA